VEGRDVVLAVSGEFPKLVTKEMKLKNVKFKFTGGVDGGRGWKGDIKNMLLDISKIKSTRMETQTQHPIWNRKSNPTSNSLTLTQLLR